MLVAKKSQIILSTEFESELKILQDELKPHRVIGFLEDSFKLEHAKAVVSEAYISESEVKYIVLAGNSFTTEAQNSLLKVLEEPPKNIEFIIISPTKSNLLPTIRSRLPITKGQRVSQRVTCELDISKLDYNDVFLFLKENARIKKDDAKRLLEALYFRATTVDKLILNEEQLDNFDKAYRLLDLNSRPQSVLAMVLMGFVIK
ncbi:MAG: DNA polymerase III subunit delta' [Campylobacterales bacterium]